MLSRFDTGFPGGSVVKNPSAWVYLPGASLEDPTHNKVMWKRPDEQGRSGLEGPPGPARASTPKPESVCLTILCFSPTLLTLTGGCPRPPFSGKSQLRASVHKSPGHDRIVSIQTPLLTLHDRFIHTLAINTHDYSQLPNLERHGKPKHSKSPNEHRVL